jgi:hypothetical protein
MIDAVDPAARIVAHVPLASACLPSADPLKRGQLSNRPFLLTPS